MFDVMFDVVVSNMQQADTGLFRGAQLVQKEFPRSSSSRRSSLPVADPMLCEPRSIPHIPPYTPRRGVINELQ